MINYILLLLGELFFINQDRADLQQHNDASYPHNLTPSHRRWRNKIIILFWILSALLLIAGATYEFFFANSSAS